MQLRAASPSPKLITLVLVPALHVADLSYPKLTFYNTRRSQRSVIARCTMAIEIACVHCVSSVSGNLELCADAWDGKPIDEL